MKAVVYKGPKKVKVEEVEDAKIQAPTDALLKVTSTAICGSDLHMYEGRSVAQPGIMIGHEIMGVIVEAGSALFSIKKGDRVVLPFNIGCGVCFNCVREFPNACHCQSAGAHCRIWVCGHGTVPWRTGRVCPRALRRL
jgi:glutathione-independent formaldehyde dehydrogenase